MFDPGKTYKRSQIHDRYGGNRQSGIAPSKKIDAIFIFTGAGGMQHGYQDKWLNDKVFSYTGEGQTGDMHFNRGNLALSDHIKNNKKVYLFKNSKKSFVDFVCELELISCDYIEIPDTHKNLRIGISFLFKKMGTELYPVPADLKLLNRESQRSIQKLKPNETERAGLVVSRVGQDAYRKSILHRWEYQCAVTKYNDPSILIASHIVPWKDSTNEERLDVDNGILLSPVYDALFDKHLISFENSGKIILSECLAEFDIEKIKMTGTERINGLSEGNRNYLERHRLILKD